jgi:hypothetical protein
MGKRDSFVLKYTLRQVESGGWLAEVDTLLYWRVIIRQNQRDLRGLWGPLKHYRPNNQSKQGSRSSAIGCTGGLARSIELVVWK